MSSAGFFHPAGNTWGVAFTTASANVLVPPTGSGTMSQVRITNNSGNAVFVSFSTTPIGNINHPTAGTSTNTISIPTGQTSFVTTGIKATGNVYINTISPAGTGTIYVQAGTLE
jgi:hypothetical protein